MAESRLNCIYPWQSVDGCQHDAGLMLRALNLHRRLAFDDCSLAPYRDPRNFRVLGPRIFTLLDESNAASEVYL